MKQIYKLIGLSAALSLFLALGTSCQNDADTTAPLVIGETADHTEASLPALAEKKIILRGGNKKYEASVADPTIARVSVVKDTLKIQGLLEGSTYATITTAEHSRRLNILVQTPDISLSKTELLLTPGEVSDIVSVTGGGRALSLQLDNPEQAIESATIAKDGRVQIKARHEGDARISFVSEGKETRVLSLRVRQTTMTDKYGFYKTTNSTPYAEMATPLIVERRGQGYTFYATARPKAGDKQLFVALTTIPTEGEQIKLNVRAKHLDAKYQTGEHSFVVESVSATTIRLRGQGYRLILPRGRQ